MREVYKDMEDVYTSSNESCVHTLVENDQLNLCVDCGLVLHEIVYDLPFMHGLYELPETTPESHIADHVDVYLGDFPATKRSRRANTDDAASLRSSKTTARSSLSLAKKLTVQAPPAAPKLSDGTTAETAAAVTAVMAVAVASATAKAKSKAKTGAAAGGVRFYKEFGPVPVTMYGLMELLDLEFDMTVAKEALVLLSTIKTKTVQKSQRNAMLCACLFYMSKKHDKPMDINDIIVRIGASKKAVSKAMKQLHLFNDVRNILLDIDDVITMIIQRIPPDAVSAADIARMHKIVKDLGPEHEALNKSRPTSIVAGLLYYVCGYVISTEIGLSMSTIRKVATNFKRVLT
jgi:hypothetical protein